MYQDIINVVLTFLQVFNEFSEVSNHQVFVRQQFLVLHESTHLLMGDVILL